MADTNDIRDGIEQSMVSAVPNLTLRDYFAAQALSGLLAGGYRHGVYNAAVLAYNAADAMLEARKPKTEPVKA